MFEVERPCGEMRARWVRVTAYGHIAFILLPLLTAWFAPAWANSHDFQIVFLPVLLLWAWRIRHEAPTPVSTRLLWAIGLAGLVAAIGHTSYLFLSFRLNGIDFSYFDWMLASTTRGRFMFAPLCDCNHFIRHPCYWLLLLQPLHGWLNSPWLLVLLEPLSWGLGAWLLVPLARAEKLSDETTLLVLIVYLTHAWSGSLLNYGFHFEVFYIPAGLLLALGWVRQAPKLWLAGALAFLMTKEDGAFYLVALTVGLLFFDRPRWRGACVMMALSLLVLAFNVGFVQRGTKPSYLGYWHDYGTDLPSIVIGMLRNPGALLRQVLTSHWWYIFGSFALAPWLTPAQLIAMLPAVFILGTGATDQMRFYRVYYAAPMLPFLYWSLCIALRRVPQLRWALLLLPLIGGGYARFPKPRMDVMQDVAEASRLEPPGPVCAQTALHPHLPYDWDLHALDSACLDSLNAMVLAHPALSAYPDTDERLRQRLSPLRTVRRWPTGLGWWSAR